ncbi:MAG: hypothetical protein ACPGUV_14355, partial [Polyangiales bacterium]
LKLQGFLSGQPLSFAPGDGGDSLPPGSPPAELFSQLEGEHYAAAPTDVLTALGTQNMPMDTVH